MRTGTSPLHRRASVLLTMSQIWTAHPGIGATDPSLQPGLHHVCLQHGHIQDPAAGGCWYPRCYRVLGAPIVRRTAPAPTAGAWAPTGHGHVAFPQLAMTSSGAALGNRSARASRQASFGISRAEFSPPTSSSKRVGRRQEPAPDLRVVAGHRTAFREPKKSPRHPQQHQVPSSLC